MTATGSVPAPGRLEFAAIWVALFSLTAGLPWEWTQVLRRGEVTGGSPIIAVFFIGIAGFLALQMNGRWPQFFAILSREPLLPLLLFLAFISFIWSGDPTTTIRRSIALLVTSYIGVHLAMRFTQFEILRMLATIFGAIVAINLVWIIFLPQFSGPPNSAGATGFDNRLTGVFTQPNPLGRVMALASFTMLAAFRLDRRRRAYYLAAGGAAVVVLLLSQSRTALLTAGTTSILLVVFLIFRARRTLFGAVAISMTTTVVGTIGFIALNLGNLTAVLDRDITLTGRVPLWQVLIPMVQENALLGRGYDAFWLGWGSPAQEVWNQEQWLPPHGHNEFLDVALTLGVGGLAIYVALLIRTTIRATRYIRDIPHVFGLWPLTYLAFFVSATVTESGVFGRDISWALLCTAVVLVSAKKREIDDPVKPELVEPSSPQPVP